MAEQQPLQKLTDRELLQVYDYVKTNPNESPLLDKLQSDEASRLSLLTNGEFKAPEGPSAIGRFVSNAADVLNPLALAKGAYQAVRHPIDTVQNIATAQADQFQQARQMFGEGRYSEAAGHGFAAAVPLLGPVAAEAGEQIGGGDVAGGLGKTAGLLVPAAAPSAVRGVVTAARRAIPGGAREAIAGALERGAASRVEDVMSPTVGPNKIRFGNKAAEVAPDVARVLAEEGAPMSRSGLHVQVRAKLMEAGQALDEAADARLVSQQVKTGPIVKQLDAEISKLTAEPAQAQKFPVATGPRQVPGEGTVIGKTPETYGKTVEPAPNAGEIGTLKQIRDEIAALGEVAPYESVRRIRQAWDQVAKAKYLPSSSADALKSMGDAIAAVKGTGAIREGLALADDATAVANKQYSVAKAANDVLNATEEIERVRPRVGRQIMARLTGVLGGQNAAGVPGAIAGYVLAPAADSALSAGVTTQLQTARLLQRLAGAIRAGDLRSVDSLTARLKRLTAQGATLQGRTTNPSGPQREPAAASGIP